MPSQKVASAYIDLQLKIAQFKAAIGEAVNETKRFTAQMREEMGKSREATRLLSEELGLGIPRGLQGIISKLPGVATAMNAAFSAVVVFALAKVIYETGKKIDEFITKAQLAGTEFVAAMNKSILATDTENSKLQLSIEKMKAHLAELEKKPATNGAALALAEARVQADELAKSLATDLAEISKLFEEKGIGGISALLTGQTGTGDVKEMVQKHIDSINEVNYGEQNKLAGLSPNDSDGRKKVQDEAQVERLKAIKAAVDDVTKEYNRLHGVSIADQKLQDKMGFGAIQGHDPHQSDAAMGILGTTGHKFQEMYNQVVLQGQAAGLSGQIAIAEQHNKGVELAKTADEKLLQQAKESLEKKKEDHVMTLQEEMDFWGHKALIQKSMGARRLMEKEETTVHVALTKQNTKNANDERFDFVRENFEEQAKQIEARKPESTDEAYAAILKAEAESKEMQKKAARVTFEGVSEDLQEKEKFAELLIRIEEASGKLTAAQAARKLQALHGAASGARIEAFGTAQNAGAGYDLKEAERLSGKDKAQELTDAQAAWSTSFQGGMDSAFNDLVKRSQDFNAQFKDLLEGTVNSVNDTLVKLMTTKDHRGLWKDTGKAIFTGVAKTSLQDAEGPLMKAARGIPGIGKFFGGGKRGDSESSPMFVKEVGNIGKAAGAGVANIFDRTASSSAASSGGSGSAVANVVGAVLPFLGGMATGGVMSPNGFYLTGERGPELLQVGNTSRINNARDTSDLLSGGGVTHNHTWNIDARGATDPAAINMAVQRGIYKATPQIISATMAATRDHASRVPSNRR